MHTETWSRAHTLAHAHTHTHTHTHTHAHTQPHLQTCMHHASWTCVVCACSDRQRLPMRDCVRLRCPVAAVAFVGGGGNTADSRAGQPCLVSAGGQVLLLWSVRAAEARKQAAIPKASKIM